ncbi:MAG: beta-galactosidase [Bacteroidetes bacterium]|nr:beta-galactosidase [Bacteroidota bacterium]MCL6102873.1 beta-galactosidase [Bacteroidota bacterium]
MISVKKNPACQTFVWFKSLLTVVLLAAFQIHAFPQVSNTDIPMIGAEVFIEPGQTNEQIDTWFRRMKEAGMTVTRIRMFESYMHKPDGTWDYSLFDMAFKAGEKYGIKIYGNAFPATSFTDVGGFKFPKSEENLRSIADYIKNMVTHFRQFSSLYGWVPINEPGSGSLPDDAFTGNKFTEWEKHQAKPTYNSKGYQELDFKEQQFLVDYNTWFLNWLTEQIHQYDPGRPVHVNNHAIFQNVAEYNFPEWRKFLTSLGGSAHASWHFGYFNRQQYAVAMSANSEILRSGAGNIPWLMTELQGGNNIYSGGQPMCPTKEEISQWLWTVIGTGSKGAIFWCLNPRASGFEAGEWAMLDFQDKPSDRMIAASDIAKIINNNPDLFAHAKVLESGINIIYTRESMWVEKKLQTGVTPYEGRNVGGVMKSALGYFEALGEMGIQANFKEIDEFDFTQKDYKGETIILAHQVSIPSGYWEKLENFVNNGGKLIVDGLTAYYDENAHCIMMTGFPLQKLFGGNIKEFKLVDNLFDVNLSIPKLILPAHLWRGTIALTSAKSIGNIGDETIASFNQYGNGEVLWIPSLLGLGGRISKDYSQLVALLNDEAKESINTIPFRFKNQQKGMMMKTLKSGNSYLTIIINKSGAKQFVQLDVKDSKLKPTVLFANKQGTATVESVQIEPEETMVLKWD